LWIAIDSKHYALPYAIEYFAQLGIEIFIHFIFNKSDRYQYALNLSITFTIFIFISFIRENRIIAIITPTTFKDMRTLGFIKRLALVKPVRDESHVAEFRVGEFA
jgi:hypothetical protein